MAFRVGSDNMGSAWVDGIVAVAVVGRKWGTWLHLALNIYGELVRQRRSAGA